MPRNRLVLVDIQNGPVEIWTSLVPSRGGDCSLQCYSRRRRLLVCIGDHAKWQERRKGKKRMHERLAICGCVPEEESGDFPRPRVYLSKALFLPFSVVED